MFRHRMYRDGRMCVPYEIYDRLLKGIGGYTGKQVRWGVCRSAEADV